MPKRDPIIKRGPIAPQRPMKQGCRPVGQKGLLASTTSSSILDLQGIGMDDADLTQSRLRTDHSTFTVLSNRSVLILIVRDVHRR